MESCPSGRRSTIGNRVDGQSRLEGSNPSLSATSIHNSSKGPLVKRLRHRPFTAVTRVRIPYGSPLYIISTLWRISSAGRASALQAEGRRFEPVILHHSLRSRGVAVNMPACHAGDREFDSRRDRHLYFNIIAGWSNKRYFLETATCCFDGYASKHNLVEKETVHSVMSRCSIITFTLSRGGAVR